MHAHEVMHARGTAAGSPVEVIALVLAAGAIGGYVAGVAASRRRGRPWPHHRTAAWVLGIVAAAASVIGPLASEAHDSFVAHMTGHLLAGMVAPLLLVLAAPVTLALRALAVTPARRVSRLLSSPAARVIAHPVTAAVMSVGTLWLIYLTPIVSAMQQSALVHAAVHLHLVVAGFVFTASIIGLDPAPHRAPRPLVAAVLVLAIAGHAVIAKWLYADPPGGFDVTDVRDGAQVMYYAGAYVEAVIVVVFCAGWYRDVGARRRRAVRA
jgi:putative membrane protein